MAISVGAPRVLLRRLREIMAQPESAQDRLDKIVIQIAAILVAEVSSVYVCRADGSLELFATEGLNQDAVHKTHLKRGEGLVGLIAEQAKYINLVDAQTHPAFSYRPETGEDPYHAFLGVPILRNGYTIGVLTVQNRAMRHYSEEEIEALETTAMVLAELIASSDIEGQIDIGADGVREHSSHVSGSPLASGIALGHVVFHEPRVVVTKLFAENTNEELGRIRSAIEKQRETIDKMLNRGDLALAGEHREILEAYRMFAHDRGWLGRLEEAIRTGLTAEAAVERVQNDTRARMLRQKDPYLRERLHDLDDLSNRLLRLLAGQDVTAASEDLPEDAIIVARTMGAAELLEYDRSSLRGLVLEESGNASHVAIVARALGIASVGQVEGLLDHTDPGDAIVVDAETGDVHIRPSQEVIDAYSDKVRFQAQKQQQFEKLRGVKAVSKDGVRVKTYINAGLLVDLPHMSLSGADGIGLYRTELQFMIASSFPRRDEQAEIYKAIIDAAGERPVVFRSLDIGGDKVLPYMRHAQEENPALGWRAIRMALDRPALFRMQIRALLRAANGRALRVMLPMISDVSEYEQARALVNREMAHMERHNYPLPSDFKLGAMLEVPSLLWQLDRLFETADFVSVGSNDLMQFLYAVDRDNQRVSGRFDVLNPTFLNVLRQIVVSAEKHNIPLTLCGEMAGHPLEALALLGLGFRSISMAPAALGPIKQMILSLDLADWEQHLLQLIERSDSSLRPAIEDYAKRNNVSV